MMSEPRLHLLGLLAVLVLALAGCAQQPVDNGSLEAAVQADVAPVQPLAPEHKARLAAADFAAAKGQWPEAEAILATLMAARPAHPELQARLAWARQQQGDRDAARDLYRDALAGDPDHLMARNNLALLLQESGEFDAARDLLEQGIERGLAAPELHFNLAVLSELYLLDLEAALTHYRAYQLSVGEADGQVKGWIVDLERRLE